MRHAARSLPLRERDASVLARAEVTVEMLMWDVLSTSKGSYISDFEYLILVARLQQFVADELGTGPLYRRWLACRRWRISPLQRENMVNELKRAADVNNQKALERAPMRGPLSGDTWAQAVPAIIEVAKWVGGGVVGTYAFQLAEGLRHRVFTSEPQTFTVTSLQVRSSARWAIEKVYAVVIDPSTEPLVETIAPTFWSVTYVVGSGRYTAWKTDRDKDGTDAAVRLEPA